jgi:hypothetical protein
VSSSHYIYIMLLPRCDASELSHLYRKKRISFSSSQQQQQKANERLQPSKISKNKSNMFTL